MDFVVATISEVASPGDRVGDLMCGTATVSEGLARASFRVVAADSLTFPVLHARARLLLRRPPNFPRLGGYQAALDELNTARRLRGFFHREYSDQGSPRNGCKPRKYFSAANAARIDGVRALLDSWISRGAITGREADLLRHDLVLAANRVANIAGTYGYYRSTWNSAALTPLKLTPAEITDLGAGHQVTQGPVENLASAIDLDVLYLDPPYTKRQYAGNYHIPETLAVGDVFEPVGEGGLRDWYPQYSDFCSKRLAADAFRAVLESCTARWVFVSYSEDGVLGADDLWSLLRAYGPVDRAEIALPRYRSNGGEAAAVTEHLYRVDMTRVRQRGVALPAGEAAAHVQGAAIGNH